MHSINLIVLIIFIGCDVGFGCCDCCCCGCNMPMMTSMPMQSMNMTMCMGCNCCCDCCGCGWAAKKKRDSSFDLLTSKNSKTLKSECDCENCNNKECDCKADTSDKINTKEQSDFETLLINEGQTPEIHSSTNKFEIIKTKYKEFTTQANRIIF